MPLPSPIAAFWDADTRRKASPQASLTDAELARFGTVTEDAAVIGLRDRLEKAALLRIADLRPEHRILDLGGGAGRIGLWLAPQVAEVVVVDFSEALIELGRSVALQRGLSNVRFVHRAVTEPIPEGPFDRIILFGVACHLEDAALPELALRCAAALAVGGRLLVKEPVLPAPPAAVDEARDPDGALRYRAWFRPRSAYPQAFAGHFACLDLWPTAPHPIPAFLGGTQEAAAATRGGVGQAAFARLAPLIERYDQALLALEERLRAHPIGQRLLAPLSAHNVLYWFAPRDGVRAAGGGPALTVVAIAYNEVEALEPVVEELLAHLRAEEIDFELIIVDDGSTDGTGALADALADGDGAIRVIHQPNGGIGAALRAGFEAARGAHVTWVPADGQIAPEAVSRLFWRRHEAPMLTTVYRHRDDPFYRTVISRSLNTLIRLRTGQVAKSGGNYLFSLDSWRRHGPRDDDSMMISTKFRHALREAGEAIIEVEIDARARVAGHSKVLNPRAIGRTLRGLFQLG